MIEYLIITDITDDIFCDELKYYITIHGGLITSVIWNANSRNIFIFALSSHLNTQSRNNVLTV